MALSSGTAFCIGSDGTDSYYLTSSHVVPEGSKSAIVPVSASPEPTGVTVVSRDSEHDAAIIQAHVRAVPIVMLSSSLPSEGQNVAIAGFPFMQIQIAELSDMGLKGLAPSLHLGSINAIVPDDTLIEFDATTDHGNSGGPLFDPSTGVVYGVVTGGCTWRIGSRSRQLRHVDAVAVAIHQGIQSARLKHGIHIRSSDAFLLTMRHSG